MGQEDPQTTDQEQEVHDQDESQQQEESDQQNEVEAEIVGEVQPLRRSTRVRKRPSNW